jgi:hypothetical protein
MLKIGAIPINSNLWVQPTVRSRQWQLVRNLFEDIPAYTRGRYVQVFLTTDFTEIKELHGE